MGLDMYLYANKYVSNYDEKAKALTLRQLFGVPLSENLESCKLSFEVFYWRKANQVHKWFIENCADGIDDCKRIEVSREQLEDLVSLCRSALKERDKAPEIFAVSPGFFFGSQDYDEYYFQDLEQTAEGIEKIIKNENLKTFDFEYRASW